ncbi:MAG: YncE family protein, partial [Gemmatimonadales bacterium]
MLRLPRALKIWIGIAAVIGAACEVSRTPGGIQGDTRPPSITLVAAPGAGTGTTPDTQQIGGGLRFNLDASDAFGLRRVTVTYTGGLTLTEDSLFSRPIQSFTMTRNIGFPPSSPVGGLIMIVGRAVDGANNVAADTLFIYLSNVNALQVFLLAPSASAVASQGLYIPITVLATQNTGVRKIGWRVLPAGLTAQSADSLLVPLPFPDTVTFTDSVQVTGASGSFQIFGFAEDSAGRPQVTSPITITIQSAANDVTPPRVEHFIALRVEVNDTITVHATDPSGIRSLGFEVRDINGVLLKVDSFAFAAATSTDRVLRFPMALNTIVGFTPPTQVIVNGFAWDGAATPNRGVSTVGFVSPGVAERDTVTVVFGQTRSLAPGSKIMDMAVDSTRNEIYMTNIFRDRLEVFTLVGDSFLAPIPTGSRPWGIALWPAANNGAYNDTVVVANSGGTNLSVIDVRPGVRREVRRHRLPNFLVEKFNTQLDQGRIKIKVEVFDLSDRPQYLGL